MKIATSAAALFVLIVIVGGVWLFSMWRETAVMADSERPVALKSGDDDCVTWDFHYLKTMDHQMSSRFRRIEVFMEAEAFTEANLKRLFRYLSDKNPDANAENNLLILVKTDWKQLGLPSDCPPSGASGGDSGRDAHKYHWASFYRRGEKEFFDYNPEKKPGSHEDVIMKGTEIYRNGVWQKPW